MDKKDMLDAIIAHYTNGNKAKFAQLLGVSAQTISAWRARNTFDLELIYTKCIGLSSDWLLTGRGSMLRSELSNNNTQSIFGDNNIQTGSNSKINAHLKDDSLEMLRLQLSEKDRLLQEKDMRIEEKDMQIREKDAQISKLLTILSK
ncbi:helix-turn-helix domain-containing protein [Phocaeicola abscessus]|uniref:helix-turn-helix domain-containing protein n=1 Tax=Phocaeicola abscessus TaxID=555313 RepID=UPI0028E5B30A|nr:helix-turn-helix domain-containing protein [Phocaeicola abscessus]